MKWTMALPAVVLAASVSAASAQTVGGKYKAQGINPDKSTYSGTAEITRDGNNCHITWDVGSEWEGQCMLSGAAFAAWYRSGDTTGLLLYWLMPNGVLEGRWTLANGDTGRESLIPTH